MDKHINGERCHAKGKAYILSLIKQYMINKKYLKYETFCCSLGLEIFLS